MDNILSRHPLFCILLGVLVALVAERTHRYVNIFGVNRRVERVRRVAGIEGDNCHVLEGDYMGSEDLTQGPHQSLVATTGGLNTLKNKFPHLYKGDKLIKITGTEIEELQLANFDHEFVPHGVDVMQVDDTNWLVFVVNHRLDGDYVEMFDWDTSKKGLKLVHFNAVSATQLGINGHINDITIVSRDSFYATNDKFFNSAVGRVGHFLGIPWCKVVFWQGAGRGATDVSAGYVEPNGIAKSPSGQLLFVTDTMANAFYEFRIAPSDGSLQLLNTLLIPTGPDNIEVLSENEVLIGCHVRLHDLFIYFSDPDQLLTASHIVRLFRDSPAAPWHWETVFMDDGTLVKGSSVGLYSRSNFYIGSVIDKIAVCPAAKEPKN